jgi:hypothetical protein
MTLFGKPTIEDVRHLMRTVEFRITRADEVATTITDEWKAANPDVYADLRTDWLAFKERWAKARKDALDNILLLNIAQPLTSASLIVDTDDWARIRKAINVGGEDTYTKGDLNDVITRIEQAAGWQIDETNHPVPDGWDPDLTIYKEVDAKIKAGEAAARAAADAAASAAKSHWGLVIIGGAVVVGGIVVATKVYL